MGCLWLLTAVLVWPAGMYFACLAGMGRDDGTGCLAVLLFDLVTRALLSRWNQRLLAREVATYVRNYGPLPAGSIVGDLLAQVGGTWVQGGVAPLLGDTVGQIAGALLPGVLGESLAKASMTPPQAALYDAICKRATLRPHYRHMVLLVFYMVFFAFLGTIFGK